MAPTKRPAQDKPPKKTRKAAKTNQPALETVQEEPVQENEPEQAIVQQTVNEGPPPQTQAAVPQPAQPELKAELFKRLPASVNPKFLTRVDKRGIIKYERPIAHRLSTKTYLTLRITQLRNAFRDTLSEYLTLRYQSAGMLTVAQAAGEIGTISTMCADACMAAIYGKLRNIHRQIGTYGNRFNTPPTISRDIELPLPFADAIHNIGMFETEGSQNFLLIIPVYPEGTRYEGRSQEDSTLISYKSYTPMLKQAGIPLKPVDTRMKAGTAWWTTRYERSQHFYDLSTIFHPSLYSSHSAVLSSMFLHQTAADNLDPIQIVDHPADAGDYGTRMRCLSLSIRFRSFAALCQGPEEEWITDSTNM